MGLARKPGSATLADLDALPPTWRGEILDGELYAFPRPHSHHIDLVGSVLDELRRPFQKAAVVRVDGGS